MIKHEITSEHENRRFGEIEAFNKKVLHKPGVVYATQELIGRSTIRYTADHRSFLAVQGGRWNHGGWWWIAEVGGGRTMRSSYDAHFMAYGASCGLLSLSELHFYTAL